MERLIDGGVERDSRTTMLELSAEQAWDNLASHASHAHWETVERRRAEGIFRPAQPETFRIFADDSLFCLGSCFAKNIERALSERGFSVPSAAIDRGGERHAIGRLPNLFSPWSIANEVGWALDSDHGFPSDGMIEHHGAIYDPHVDHFYFRSDPDVARQRRAQLDATMRKIRSCRIVIITLGLTEVWFDRRTGLHMNTALPYDVMRAHPGRFAFRRLDVTSCLEALTAIHAALRRRGHEDVRVVLTVSPVPLKATFTGDDVAVANTISKATLRVAAEQFRRAHDNVYYLPSFESVTHSERRTTFEADGRHVTRPVVDDNVSRFLRAFVSSDRPRDESERPPREFPVPNFWRATAGDHDFPSGLGTVTTSSVADSVSDGACLMSAAGRIWHAQSPPRYPESILIEFERPLHAGRLWMRCQTPDRAPEQFLVEGALGDDRWVTLTEVASAGFAADRQWKSWSLAGNGGYVRFRVTIRANGGNRRFLTVSKIWLEPSKAGSCEHAETLSAE